VYQNSAGSIRFKEVIRIAVTLVYIVFSGYASASVANNEQRQLFRQAEKALQDNNQVLFEQLSSSLRDYPVRAYLEHDAFKARMGDATVTEVRQFLQQHKQYPFHYHLLSKWLNILAQRKDWDNYLAFYDGRSATRFKCLALTARLEKGQVENINQEIKSIWLTGYSQPRECDNIFDYFLSTDSNVNESIWLRIEKAFKARRSSLARYLAKKLDKKDQVLVEQWYQAHRHPQKQLKLLVRDENNLMNRKILIHALDRLARKDSLLAKEYWERARKRFSFNEEQIQQIEMRIALSAAYQHEPESKQLLEQLPEEIKTDNAHLWLARIHLRDEDWIGLIKTINAMPPHLKEESEWSYWLARSYAQAGHKIKADGIYQELAQRGTYYGFLAADKTGREYHIDQQYVTDNMVFNEREFLHNNVHLLRARELFFLDRPRDARREWFQAMRKLSIDEIKQAAYMASNWKWHDNAIKTVAKTTHRNDYELRFPMPYEQQVMANIRLHDLDPSVIYGVMRRESLFDPLARSSVGALGLMQLMPATARGVAKSLGLKRPGQSEILNITNNIKLGTTYFKKVLSQFDDNVSLASAAYNAGPKNVKRWLPENEPMSADLWVETVPYKETRNYIQAVLAYATIFDKKRGQDVQISSRMADVRPSY
jgi:soluble lytic murein transglycosylase